MKTVVSVQEITELEIKPTAEVGQWLDLVESEIAERWRNRASWLIVSCPCCGASATSDGFIRFTIDYVECRDCQTVYAPRRPSEAQLVDWYRDSEPAHFWRDRMLLASGEARRLKIVRPRAQWVLDGMAEYARDATSILDLSTNGRALLDEVLAATGLGNGIAAGWAADLEGIGTTALHVRPTVSQQLHDQGPVDVVTAFDIFDRAADLRVLVSAIQETLAPRGLLFATVPVSTGFELQALWERSPTVLPPDKINLPSIKGLQRLFASPRWELIELSTTGMFDVEIVRRTIEAQPNARWPRVVRSLVEETDEQARQALTEFLQSQRLTSFARLVARSTA